MKRTHNANVNSANREQKIDQLNWLCVDKKVDHGQFEHVCKW